MTKKLIKISIAVALTASLFGASLSINAYPPFVKKAAKFGAKDCTFCHTAAEGGEGWNERGKWLVAEKDKRTADAIDVEWLADYKEGGATGAVKAGATEAADKVEDAGDATKKGVKKAANETADKVEDAGDATKKGVKKGATKTADKAEDVGDAAKKGTKKAANETADKTEDVGDATKKGAKATGKGAKKVGTEAADKAEDVGDAAKKALGIKDKDKKDKKEEKKQDKP